MNLHRHVIPPTVQMLKNLDAWLGKAEAHAKAKSFEVDTLLQARLAPDQYPLVRQIQAACDSAKFLAARLTGKEAPKHPDTETTFEQIHARVKSVLGFLESFREADFEGADARVVPLPFAEGKGMLGADYLGQMQLPNFYFHAVHAYAILRHNGVDLGKRDYIGMLSMRDL